MFKNSSMKIGITISILVLVVGVLGFSFVKYKRHDIRQVQVLINSESQSDKVAKTQSSSRPIINSKDPESHLLSSYARYPVFDEESSVSPVSIKKPNRWLIGKIPPYPRQSYKKFWQKNAKTLKCYDPEKRSEQQYDKITKLSLLESFYAMSELRGNEEQLEATRKFASVIVNFIGNVAKILVDEIQKDDGGVEKALELQEMLCKKLESGNKCIKFVEVILTKGEGEKQKLKFLEYFKMCDSDFPNNDSKNHQQQPVEDEYMDDFVQEDSGDESNSDFEREVELTYMKHHSVSGGNNNTTASGNAGSGGQGTTTGPGPNVQTVTSSSSNNNNNASQGLNGPGSSNRPQSGTTTSGQQSGNRPISGTTSSSAHSTNNNNSTSNVNNRRPESATSRRPESATSRRPESATSRRPESATSRRPESATSRRPESASRRPPSATQKIDEVSSVFKGMMSTERQVYERPVPSMYVTTVETVEENIVSDEENNINIKSSKVQEPAVDIVDDVDEDIAVDEDDEDKHQILSNQNKNIVNNTVTAQTKTVTKTSNLTQQQQGSSTVVTNLQNIVNASRNNNLNEGHEGMHNSHTPGSSSTSSSHSGGNIQQLHQQEKPVPFDHQKLVQELNQKVVTSQTQINDNNGVNVGDQQLAGGSLVPVGASGSSSGNDSSNNNNNNVMNKELTSQGASKFQNLSINVQENANINNVTIDQQNNLNNKFSESCFPMTMPMSQVPTPPLPTAPPPQIGLPTPKAPSGQIGHTIKSQSQQQQQQQDKLNFIEQQELYVNLGPSASQDGSSQQGGTGQNQNQNNQNTNQVILNGGQIINNQETGAPSTVQSTVVSSRQAPGSGSSGIHPLIENIVNVDITTIGNQIGSNNSDSDFNNNNDINTSGNPTVSINIAGVGRFQDDGIFMGETNKRNIQNLPESKNGMLGKMITEQVQQAQQPIENNFVIDNNQIQTVPTGSSNAPTAQIQTSSGGGGGTIRDSKSDQVSTISGFSNMDEVGKNKVINEKLSQKITNSLLQHGHNARDAFRESLQNLSQIQQQHGANQSQSQQSQNLQQISQSDLQESTDILYQQQGMFPHQMSSQHHQNLSQQSQMSFHQQYQDDTALTAANTNNTAAFFDRNKQLLELSERLVHKMSAKAAGKQQQQQYQQNLQTKELARELYQGITQKAVLERAQSGTSSSSGTSSAAGGGPSVVQSLAQQTNQGQDDLNDDTDSNTQPSQSQVSYTDRGGGTSRTPSMFTAGYSGSTGTMSMSGVKGVFDGVPIEQGDYGPDISRLGPGGPGGQGGSGSQQQGSGATVPQQDQTSTGPTRPQSAMSQPAPFPNFQEFPDSTIHQQNQNNNLQTPKHSTRGGHGGAGQQRKQQQQFQQQPSAQQPSRKQLSMGSCTGIYGGQTWTPIHSTPQQQGQQSFQVHHEMMFGNSLFNLGTQQQHTNSNQTSQQNLHHQTSGYMTTAGGASTDAPGSADHLSQSMTNTQTTMNMSTVFGGGLSSARHGSAKGSRPTSARVDRNYGRSGGGQSMPMKGVDLFSQEQNLNQNNNMRTMGTARSEQTAIPTSDHDQSQQQQQQPQKKKVFISEVPDVTLTVPASAHNITIQTPKGSQRTQTTVTSPQQQQQFQSPTSNNINKTRSSTSGKVNINELTPAAKKAHKTVLHYMKLRRKSEKEKVKEDQLKLDRDTQSMEYNILFKCSQLNEWLKELKIDQDYRCGMTTSGSGLRQITIWLFEGGEAKEQISRTIFDKRYRITKSKADMARDPFQQPDPKRDPKERLRRKKIDKREQDLSKNPRLLKNPAERENPDLKYKEHPTKLSQQTEQTRRVEINEAVRRTKMIISKLENHLKTLKRMDNHIKSNVSQGWMKKESMENNARQRVYETKNVVKMRRKMGLSMGGMHDDDGSNVFGNQNQNSNNTVGAKFNFSNAPNLFNVTQQNRPTSANSTSATSNITTNNATINNGNSINNFINQNTYLPEHQDHHLNKHNTLYHTNYSSTETGLGVHHHDYQKQEHTYHASAADVMHNMFSQLKTNEENRKKLKEQQNEVMREYEAQTNNLLEKVNSTISKTVTERNKYNTDSSFGLNHHGGSGGASPTQSNLSAGAHQHGHQQHGHHQPQQHQHQMQHQHSNTILIGSGPAQHSPKGPNLEGVHIHIYGKHHSEGNHRQDNLVSASSSSNSNSSSSGNCSGQSGSGSNSSSSNSSDTEVNITPGNYVTRPQSSITNNNNTNTNTEPDHDVATDALSSTVNLFDVGSSTQLNGGGSTQLGGGASTVFQSISRPNSAMKSVGGGGGGSRPVSANLNQYR